MAKLSVSIVNWNTRDSLRRCLESLRSGLGGMDATVFVVDNASSDGSAAMVAEAFPEVRLLAQDRNLGFAAGNNRVMERTDADYLLILNPDIVIPEGAIARLVDFLEREPEVAAVSPLLTGADGRPHAHMYRRFPSMMQVLLFWTLLGGVARRLGPLRRRYLEHDLRGSEPVLVDQLPGAALLIRRSAIERVGPMDPGYFIWFEDVDWCYRARKAGLRLAVLPGIHFVHEGGASFRTWSLETRVHQFYRAFVRFLGEHRLDRLRDRAVIVLTADLWLKELLVRAARPFLGSRAPNVRTLRPTRVAIREVAAAYRGGGRVVFTDASVAEESPPACSMEPVRIATADPRPRSPVDVVIVNWNGRRYLPGCLRALGRSTLPVRVIVVDNASTDGSVEYLREAHSDVEVIALDRNLGYAGGANVGLRAGSARYALVMNADVLLRPDHLERLVARLEADPGIGAAQGKLYRISPTEFDALPFPGSRILDSAGHRILRSRMVVDRGSGRPDGVEYSREASVFSVCGAAIFLRRAMLEDLSPGGEFFDESFFAYKEDIDLCWRARLLGWEIRYVPDAIGYHVRSWAGEAAPPKDRIPLVARRHSWVNHYALLLKNDRILDLIHWAPWVGAWEVVRQGYALLRDPALYGAYMQLVRRVPEALRQRRDIFSRRRSRPADLATWFTVDSHPVPASREAPVD